ncbi:hypothetical protein GGX14DRAFT_586219 [Mycena pura]|uniref:Uncharacterized protein n=1 Tax=Mycena pura TaxID=153505 RepID=A0AAD6VS11_9AGAR|nr:hypothetical protein GGX14DRAFT_586219 [Mycena pura]
MSRNRLSLCRRVAYAPTSACSRRKKSATRRFSLDLLANILYPSAAIVFLVPPYDVMCARPLERRIQGEAGGSGARAALAAVSAGCWIYKERKCVRWGACRAPRDAKTPARAEGAGHETTHRIGAPNRTEVQARLPLAVSTSARRLPAGNYLLSRLWTPPSFLGDNDNRFAESRMRRIPAGPIDTFHKFL